MKKVPFLPNVITSFGLSCGLFVIFKMTMLPLGQADLQVLTATTGLMLLAAFADLLDGAVARAMKAESEFGGIFDSISDAITFGVGPSIIVFKSFSIPNGTEHTYLLTTAMMVFSVCGVLRLVRFNILSSQAKRDLVLHEANHKNFTGLPITAAAALAVSANLFLVSDELRLVHPISDDTRRLVMLSTMLFLGYLMISRWKFPSLKNLHISVKSFRVVFLTVLCAVFIFYGFLHHFPLVFFILSWTYLLISLILSLTRLISGKKSKTLQDFEPASDDLESET